MDTRNLPNVMMRASRSLVAEWEEARQNFDHNGIRGSGGEEAIKRFFRNRLPTNIGVAQGQVIDANGQLSTQIDVILYHADRTPILFSDSTRTNMLVPAEGVIAAIEVKTRFDSASVRETLKSARQIKALRRDCYYETSSPIVNTTQAHGKQLKRLPIMYFAIGLESISPTILQEAFLIAQLEYGCDMVVDLWCVPEKWTSANAILEIVEGSGPKVKAYDTLPTPFSVPQIIPNGQKSLLFFYLLLCRMVLQAEIEPIELQRYLPTNFVMYDPASD